MTPVAMGRPAARAWSSVQGLVQPAVEQRQVAVGGRQDAVQNQQVAQVGRRPPRRHAAERLVRDRRARVGEGAQHHLLDMRAAGPGYPAPRPLHLAERCGERRQLGPDAAGPVVEEDGQPLGQDAVAAGVPAVADPFPSARRAGEIAQPAGAAGAQPSAIRRDAGRRILRTARRLPARACGTSSRGSPRASAPSSSRWRGRSGRRAASRAGRRSPLRPQARSLRPARVQVDHPVAGGSLPHGRVLALVAISSAGVQAKT